VVFLLPGVGLNSLLWCVYKKLNCFNSSLWTWNLELFYVGLRLCMVKHFEVKIFKPSLPTDYRVGCCLLGCVLLTPVHASVHASVCPCVQYCMFPQYLQCLLMDVHQTFVFVIRASWDKDELTRFGVKGQGHIITTEASNTWRFHRVKLSRLYAEMTCVFVNCSECFCGATQG